MLVDKARGPDSGPRGPSGHLMAK